MGILEICARIQQREQKPYIFMNWRTNVKGHLQAKQACMHTHIYTHTHTYTGTYTQAHIHRHTHTQAHIHTHTHTHR